MPRHGLSPIPISPGAHVRRRREIAADLTTLSNKLHARAIAPVMTKSERVTLTNIARDLNRLIGDMRGGE